MISITWKKILLAIAFMEISTCSLDCNHHLN